MSGIVGTSPNMKSGRLGVFPTGHIIKQTHGESFTGNNDTTSSSYTASGLSLACTFTAGNKIWIVASVWIGAWNGGDDTGSYFKFYDETNSAELVGPTEDAYSYVHAQGGTAGWEGLHPFSQVYTPPSGTSITFQIYHKVNWGGTSRVDRRRSMITLNEVQV